MELALEKREEGETKEKLERLLLEPKHRSAMGDEVSEYPPHF